MQQEIELKLLAGASFDPAAVRSVLEDVLAQLKARTHTETFEQQDSYLDTSAGELVRLGLAARVRSKNGAQVIEVKPVPIESGLVMRRAELTAPVSKKGTPGRTLRKLLAKMLGVALDHDAHEVLRLVTKRERTTVKAEDGTRVELCVDHVQVQRVEGDETATVGRFVEVEVELLEGDEAVVRRIGEALATLDLSASGRSKFQRARDVLGLPPYRCMLQAPDFTVKSSVFAVAHAVCLHQLRLIQHYEAGTRIGLDTEYLHKMRVATRRLRTALRVFADAFEPAQRRAISRGIRWLGRRLGAVRDLDVALLELPRWRNTFGPEPATGWQGLEERLVLRRTRARRELLDALDSARWVELAEQAEAWFTSDGASGPALEVSLAERTGVRVQAFETGVETFARTQSLDDAHALRILGKRLRYALEFVRPALSRDIKPLLKRLSAFQDQLGRMQDAATAGAFALDEAASESDVAVAFALGTLRGAAAREAELARTGVQSALRELNPSELGASLREAIG